jgi:hypothetical protein
MHLSRSVWARCANWFYCAVAVVASLLASRLAAQPLVVAGSPGYDSMSGTGFQVVPYSVVPPEIGVNRSGIAVGTADRFVAGNDNGPRAVRWDGTGTAAAELGNLGTTSGGITNARAFAVNTVPVPRLPLKIVG